ncbi:glycosyltransferase family 4 protein [Aneurinibacillus sp. Ricciae_BoGa-3]|uniref:glycosyltransferase family 4 protein n=1 Tax=Aneurinibacillus sp. Ricciae_BoGa-3 TaxID=3022697 RepID=UPI002340B8CF|nr:glycosyltransferase family 4 protein [Aneurinibacillus sp. Ricciae_BoGa-3]WCK56172.1 glycosyltransferase family 4 protein [Aneurinibacillus sp. Ricciae_BoGa-3]
MTNKPINIHYRGSVFEPTGYAKVSRSLMLEMARLGASIKFTPCIQEAVSDFLDSDTVSLLNSLHHNPLPDNHIVLFNFIPTFLMKDNPKNFHIGLTMFECNRLPLGWEDKCNQMDEIWVPSTFNYHTFVDSGVLPAKLRVMPLGVDTNIFRRQSPLLEIEGKRNFAFLTLASSWDSRKGFESLLRAFFEEFREDEDVSLIVKTRVASQEETFQQQSRINQIAEEISGIRRHSVILISTRENWTDARLAQLYNSANCYVLPTHGEGWNMTVMEAMAVGLPVITTNWSAHLDFINNTNGYLIEVQGFQKIHAWNTDLFYSQPNKEHLKHLMRHVYQNPSEAVQKARIAQEMVTNNYTWAKSAKRMLNRIQEI